MRRLASVPRCAVAEGGQGACQEEGYVVAFVGGVPQGKQAFAGCLERLVFGLKEVQQGGQAEVDVVVTGFYEAVGVEHQPVPWVEADGGGGEGRLAYPPGVCLRGGGAGGLWRLGGSGWVGGVRRWRCGSGRGGGS